MLDFNSVVIGIIIGIGGLFLLYLLLLFFTQPERNKRLIEWSKTVPITDNQAFAMKCIWDSHLLGSPLNSVDLVRDVLLDGISQKDWDHILTICEPDFRPPEFGSGKSMFDTHVKYLQSKGYAEELAKIVNGMKLNGYVARFALEEKEREKKHNLLMKRFYKGH